ncbi:MAG: tetratricopeptide repeat protein [Methylovirgula sp.]
MTRVIPFISIGLLATALAGCIPLGSPPPVVDVTPTGTTLTVQNPNDEKIFPSDEPMRLGEEFFNRGIYGKAAQCFQTAVEKAPKNADAWIALAAAYDRLARFDLADRAYHQAIMLIGETTEILNNEGFSYLLRGKLAAARGKFMEAYQRDPTNRTILNNIALLNGSYRFIEREP